ncbi:MULTISPECIES: alpha/beta fold hydrolase [Prochlorococcus]|uniref:alpha/beta fold hydrolase n=1 Tax=Prochlorococcus TaxID=1218 RepID=UPI0005339F4A|nr:MULTISPECIES: alpha/beta fold hydrolase [Prochlorococcus]KGG13659.1 putative alpha/beta hydrolase [Prochlorococcus sp. MIT 0601]
MTKNNIHCWQWNELNVSWKVEGYNPRSSVVTVLIHGFGASKEHWRKNQIFLGNITPSYSLDLIGFGDSSQPIAILPGEKSFTKGFLYNFDNWGLQVSEFCRLVIKKPVIFIGNSIGGVVALRAARSLQGSCKGVILINCAQRTMDDKRLSQQTKVVQLIRPFLKNIIRKKWLSKSLFQNAANPNFIEKILKQAYPSGQHLDKELINLIYSPTQREGAAEAFHGFVNIFNDHLAPDLMKNLNVPVDLIWGDSDPWEALSEARQWLASIKCIRSLEIIKGAGHCPHDEAPEKVNGFLGKIIQQAT